MQSLAGPHDTDVIKRVSRSRSASNHQRNLANSTAPESLNGFEPIPKRPQTKQSDHERIRSRSQKRFPAETSADGSQL